MPRPLLILLALVLLAAAAFAAPRRDLKKVSLDTFIEEIQRDAPGDDLSLVWWMPAEYWRASFLQREGARPPEADALSRPFEQYLVVTVARAKVGELGQMRPQAKDAVAAAMTATWTDSTGKAHPLEPAADVAREVTVAMDAAKPIFRQMLGDLGANFHVYYFRGQTPAGQRLASPYERGKLTIAFKATPDLPATTHTYETPLNCLFEPRPCPRCTKPAHVTWNFCPFCGEALPPV